MVHKEEGGLFFYIALLNKINPLNGSAAADIESQSGTLSWFTKKTTHLPALQNHLLSPAIIVPKITEPDNDWSSYKIADGM